ncbi:MAG TPA: thioredoxin family protein [Burkholderiaceae bacterium]|nr:thioredoxin family protein [Burkholderiaceae bacterium]
MPIQSVYCLCAAWCDTCQAFRTIFDAVGAEHAGIRFEWIDIEDEADLVDDVDVETFPTILALADGRAAFCAPIRPQRKHLEAVLTTPAQDALPREVRELGDRLRQRELDAGPSR